MDEKEKKEIKDSVEKTKGLNMYEKLKFAREFISNKPQKKNATNTHSHYNYFTPEHVEKQVREACDMVNCICMCNLLQDELGYFQKLEFINLSDSDDILTCELRTKHGSMTATNDAQQMGGTDTYSERYIKMKFFCIKDNSMDLDSKDNSGKASAPKANNYDDKPTIKIWFDPKNETHIKSVQSYRDQGMENKDIIKQIRSTPGFGLAKKYAEKILNGEI